MTSCQNQGVYWAQICFPAVDVLISLLFCLSSLLPISPPQTILFALAHVLAFIYVLLRAIQTKGIIEMQGRVPQIFSRRPC